MSSSRACDRRASSCTSTQLLRSRRASCRTRSPRRRRARRVAPRWKPPHKLCCGWGKPWKPSGKTSGTEEKSERFGHLVIYRWNGTATSLRSPMSRPHACDHEVAQAALQLAVFAPRPRALRRLRWDALASRHSVETRTTSP